MKRRACLVVLILLLFTGCTEPPAETPPTAVPTTSAPAGAAADLAPAFRTDADVGTVPQELLVELPRDVFTYGDWGEDAPAGTVLTVDPPLAGTLKVRNLSTLAFHPGSGFEPGRSYTFELQSVKTQDGVVRPDETTGPWRYELHVPEFSFVRFGLSGADQGADVTVLEIVFSGPVDPADVRRRTRLQAVDPGTGQSRVVTASFSPTDKSHVVLASLPSRGLVPGTRLELVLDEGIASATFKDLHAAGATASLRFGEQPPIRIADVRRLEADSGFFLRVFCDDKGVPDRLGFWDEDSDGFWELSRRCIPDEDAAREKIRFEPAVAFSVAPGRGGFRIFGDFERGNYKLTIAPGLTSIDGGELQSTFETRFEVPARRPYLAFVSQGRYLPRSAWQLVPLRHTNVGQARLAVRHVRPENLVFWMSDDDSEAATERTSDLIESRTLPLRGENDAETTSYVDLGSIVPASTRGLLELDVRAGAAHDTARVLLTDLHLVAKRSGDGSLAVWTLDMHSLKPQDNVEVSLLRKSGRSLATCTTRGDGECHLVPQTEGDPDPSPPFALVARRQDDLTYLKFSELKAEVQETRVAGDPYRGGQKYRAALYGERGVYRPGETAHLAAIVRGEDNLAPPAGMPVQTVFVDPRGTVFRRATLTTNEAGYVTVDQTFPAFATTGRYEVRLEAADVRIGGHSFQVEEFVPERMKVEATPAEPSYLLGATKEIEIEARYLFGGVPAQHRVELRCDLEPGAFEPAENANYHYGVWRGEDAPARGVTLGTASGVLDGDGRARLTCPDGAGGFAGPARLVARAAVFEAGSGRTTVGRVDVPVHPAAFYVGLSSGTAKVNAGDELVVDGVTVDFQGRLVTNVDEVEVELLRVETEWGWYFDEARGYWSSRTVKRPVTAERTTAHVLGGKFRVAFRPSSDAASFLVRARSGAARTDLELQGRGGWYYRAPEEGDRTPAPGRPNWIALDVPKTSGVGDAIQVSFEAPYAGRVLFTAETDEVLAGEWKKVDSGRVSWSYKPRKLVPNLYVTAFLVKDPHLDGEQAFLPERSFGVASVRLEPTELTHPLKLEAPQEVRSNSHLTVELDLGKNEGSTYATVAAVDEGILSLTGFQSPDPFPAIFTRRALGVDTFETVGWTLLIPPAGPTSTAGGDTAGGELGRVPPVKPVALWAGLVEVPKSGKVEVGFDVPQYRGALRVMAVSAGPKKMGHAAATVTVRDPLVVEATLPRFLTRGDDVRVPVFVTNVSGERRDVEVTIDVEAAPVPGFDDGGAAVVPVEVLGDRKTGFALADGDADTAVFRLAARQPAGAVRVRVAVRSGDVHVEDEAEVPLLPAGPKTRRVERIELQQGETDLKPLLAGWAPLSERTTFWATSQPYADALGHVEQLLHYPYGCIEQTTSTTRPLLYLADLLPTIAPDAVAGSAVEDMVKSGIARILSMQTPSGGFSYWPGGTEPTYWGTAYATHLLLDAQKERYSVPQEGLDDALAWMELQVTHHYETGQSRENGYSRDAEPYIHYVLALAGRARKARIERLITDLGRPRSQQDQENLFLLQAALYAAGDQRYEANLKSPDLSPITDERFNGWSFYSDRRRRGFMLATFVDLFGDDPAGEPLANLVAEGLRGRDSSWYTTQELVWGITGLGKYSRAGASDFSPPVLRADGRQVAPAPAPPGRGESDRTWNVARASEYGEMTIGVAKKGEGKLYLILTSVGVREDGGAEYGGEGLMLTRRYRTPEGEPVDFNTHRLGDLVYVELALTNTSPERIENVALVDRVPSAWEIENPRLGRDSAPSWVNGDELWEMDHLDLRDDRLEVFGHLEKGDTKTVVYAVRAVTAGRFTVPTVEAEAMYDPRIWSRQRGREIFVNGPWLAEESSTKKEAGP